MVPVGLAENQLPPTVMKRSHKVRVTKKDVYLTNDNFADDEGNITESKERESKNQ